MAEMKNGHNLPKVDLLVRSIMKEKHITTDMLAERLGVAKSTMATKLRGNMTINTLYDIAQVLECEIADFFPRKDSKDTLVPTVNGEESHTTPVTEEGHDVFCPRCGAKFRMY